MIQDKLFGSSGIRRIFNNQLIDIIADVSNILSINSPKVIIGRDTRITSPFLSQMIASIINNNGGNATIAGVVPTPTTAFATREFDIGCMVTASHNPENYNGIKLFNQNGSSFTQTQQLYIENLIKISPIYNKTINKTIKTIDITQQHKTIIKNNINVKSNLKVVIDCGNGAGCNFTPDLLSDIGINLTKINCDPSGKFNRPSEPLEKNVSYIGEIVKKTTSDCAIIHDGDADRTMAFDNKGRYITGDKLLVLFAKYLNAKRIVTTNDTSMIIDDIADVKRTSVGDTYVSEELLKWGDFGGETSGAWIFPKISYCPDGPFAASLLCEIASEWDISSEINDIPSYPIYRDSFTCNTMKESNNIVINLGATIPTDGIRVSYNNGWILIRSSGTEPKIRMTVEGFSQNDLKTLISIGINMITESKKKIRK